MALKRLVGSDGALIVGAFGPDIAASATLEAGVRYKIVGIDGTSSIFPSGIELGYLFTAAGGEVLATDDVCQEFESEKMCDIQSWSLDFSKAEIDVSALCDNTKVYRASKYDDVSGSMEGIMTTDLTDQPGKLLNRFVAIVKQDGSTYTISAKDESEIFAELMTDDTEISGESQGFYFTPVVLTGFSASAGGDDAQSFSTPFRIAPSETGLVYYVVTNA